jgi:4-hydroxy-4-methyl-2-oxoglutarate aldolase
VLQPCALPMKLTPVEILTRLSQFDTPTICNVIELCQYQPRNTGYLTHRIRSIFPEMPPVVGYAVTVKFRSATVATAAEKPLGFPDLIDAWRSVPAPRVVVIQDLDEAPAGAVCGEIMVTYCKALGCVGLVTNGSVRDIHQIKALQFPCFASGISPSHANCRLLLAGSPVTVDGMIIKMGDLLHGDANGITTVPHEIASKVAGNCGAYVTAEQILIEGGKNGPLSIGRLQTIIEEFTKEHDRLSKTLSGEAADRRVGV